MKRKRIIISGCLPALRKFLGLMIGNNSDKERKGGKCVIEVKEKYMKNE